MRDRAVKLRVLNLFIMGQKGARVARTLSWLDRIVPIARTVSESSRSHYAREDLQKLFEIQPRSAQNLMAAMPIISVGSAHLVEREALRALLLQLNEAEDPTRALCLLRSKTAKPRRRRLRALSLNDVSADLEAIPENISLKPGEVTVCFKSIDQLAEGMLCLAALLQHHLDDFAARYEPPQEQTDEDLGTKEKTRLDADDL